MTDIFNGTAVTDTFAFFAPLREINTTNEQTRQFTPGGIWQKLSDKV
jgi:hypothetical protein